MRPPRHPIIATRTAGTMKFPRTAFSRSSSLASPNARRAMTAARPLRSVFGSALLVSTPERLGPPTVEEPCHPEDPAHARHGLVGRLRRSHHRFPAPANHLGVLFTRRSDPSRNAIFSDRKIVARFPEVYPQAGGAKIVTVFKR